MMEAIEAYTGLSPTAFFTIIALMLGVYRLVCAVFFVDPGEEIHSLNPKPPPPIQREGGAVDHQSSSSLYLGDSVTEEELKSYDGSDPTKPLLMAVSAHIYDVSASRMFYGPGGPYALFAGRDASRALALMSFDSNDLTGDIEGLEPSELEILQDWEYKFQEKYPKVGKIVTGRKRDIVTESVERRDGSPEPALIK